MDYAELLADDIISAAKYVMRQQELGCLDDHAKLVRSDYGVNDVKTKEWIEIPVLISSEWDGGQINDGTLIVGAMLGKYEAGNMAIELVVNGAYTWSKLKELRSYLVKSVYENLIHELTHLADYAYRDGKEHLSKKPSDAEYYGDKFEMTAFIQELTDEALARAESYTKANRPAGGKKHELTRDMMLDHVYAGKIWRDRVPNMQPRDRAKVLKVVYSALVDAGYL